jgi:hypothetical protein
MGIDPHTWRIMFAKYDMGKRLANDEPGYDSRSYPLEHKKPIRKIWDMRYYQKKHGQKLPTSSSPLSMWKR